MGILFLLIQITSQIDITMFPQEIHYINRDLNNISDMETINSDNSQLMMSTLLKEQISRIRLSENINNVLGIQQILTFYNQEWINCIAILFDCQHLQFVNMQDPHTNIKIDISDISYPGMECQSMVKSSDQNHLLLDCYIDKVVYVIRIDEGVNYFDANSIKTSIILLPEAVQDDQYYITLYQEEQQQFYSRFKVYEVRNNDTDYQLFKCNFTNQSAELVNISNINEFPEFQYMTDAAFISVRDDYYYISITSQMLGYYVYQINANNHTMKAFHQMTTHSRDIFYSVIVYRPLQPYNIFVSQLVPEITVLTHSYILQFALDADFFIQGTKLNMIFKKVLSKGYPDEAHMYSKEITLDESYFYVNSIVLVNDNNITVTLEYMERRIKSESIIKYKSTGQTGFNFTCFLTHYNRPQQLSLQENKGIIFTKLNGTLRLIKMFPIQSSYEIVSFKDSNNQYTNLHTNYTSIQIEQIQLNTSRIIINPKLQTNISTENNQYAFLLNNLFIGQAIHIKVKPKTTIITNDMYTLYNYDKQQRDVYNLTFNKNSQQHIRIFSQNQLQSNTIYTLIQGPDNSIALSYYSINQKKTNLEQIQVGQGIVTNFDIIEQTLQIVLTIYDEFNKSKSIEIIQCNIHKQSIQLQQSYEDRTFFNMSTVELLLKQSVEVLEIKQYSHPFSLNNFYLVDILGDDKIEQYLFYTPLTYESFQIIKLDIQQLITIIEVNMVVYNYLFVQDTKGIIYYFSLPAIKQSQIPLIQLNRFRYQTQEENNDIEFKLIDFRRFEFYKPPGILIIDYKQNTIDVFYIRNISQTIHERQRIPLFYSLDLKKMRKEDFEINKLWFLRIGSLRYFRIIDQYFNLYVDQDGKPEHFELHSYDLLQASGNQLRIVHCGDYLDSYNLWFFPKAYTIIKEIDQFQRPILSFMALNITQLEDWKININTTIYYYIPTHLQVQIVTNQQSWKARKYIFNVSAESGLVNVTTDSTYTNLSVSFELQDEFISVDREQPIACYDLSSGQNISISEQTLIGSLSDISIKGSHVPIESHLQKYNKDQVLIYPNDQIKKVIPIKDVLFILSKQNTLSIFIDNTIIHTHEIEIHDVYVDQLLNGNYLIIIIKDTLDSFKPYFYQFQNAQLNLIHNMSYYSNIVWQQYDFLNLKASTIDDIFISYVTYFNDCNSKWVDTYLTALLYNSTGQYLLNYITALDFKEDFFQVNITDMQMIQKNYYLVFYFTTNYKNVFNLTMSTTTQYESLDNPKNYDFPNYYGQSYYPKIQAFNHLTIITSNGLMFYNSTTGQNYTYKWNIKCQDMNQKYQILTSFSIGVLCNLSNGYSYAYYALPTADPYINETISTKYMRELIQVTNTTNDEELITLWKYNESSLDDPIICLLVKNASHYFIKQYKLFKDRTINNSNISYNLQNLVVNLCADDTQFCSPIVLINQNYSEIKYQLNIWSICLYLSLLFMIGLQVILVIASKRSEMRKIRWYAGITLVEQGNEVQ